jgi:hypothetical protein
MSTTRTMYLHTLDGKPASFNQWRDMEFLNFAAGGHRSRAATLVGSLDQIRREQQQCIRSDWQQWTMTKPEHRGERPSMNRYGYVLVEVPNV